MNETDNETDTVSVWMPYEPGDDAPWNLRRVVHLHRRVVFGACWSEIQRDLAEGPEAAVSRVLDGRFNSLCLSPTRGERNHERPSRCSRCVATHSASTGGL